MRTLVALATAVACLALAGAVSAAGPLVVAFKPLAPGPKVTVKWPYRLVVTQGGKPAKGKLTVTIRDPLGQVHPVEDDAADRPIKNRAFSGAYTDKLLFPVEAKGFPLVLRFAVAVGAAKKTLEVTVTPK